MDLDIFVASKLGDIKTVKALADGNFKDDTGMTYKDLIYKIEKPL